MRVQVETEGFSIVRHWSALRLAIQFLTAIPVAGEAELDKTTMGLSLLYYPVVGVLVGTLLVGLALVGQWMFSPLLAAVVVVTAWVLVTGALHIDGLADCADAWVGGFGSRERTLELMKDPTSGPVAIAVVVMLLLLKVTLVVELLAQGLVNVWVFGLLVAPFLGRLSVLALFLTTPYVRKLGLGEILAVYFPRRCGLVFCGVYVASMLLIEFHPGLIVIGSVALTIAFLRRLMLSRLGGCTGDTLGATVEMVEVVVLLVIAAVV